MNNQIPYKLSNVIYHLPKLLDSFSAGGLREVKNYFKLNGYDLTIQHYGVETLLDIIMKEICVEGNWNELSYNMEYNNFEKKQLSLFFQNFYNYYANKTLLYQDFFAELLQSNLDDLVETGDIDFRDIANLKNSTIIDVDQMESMIVDKVCDYKGNSEWITGFHNIILDAENKSINNYLDDIYYYVENTVQEQELSAVERFYLQSWVFNGLVKNIVFNIDPNDELVDFTYDIKSLNELKKYFNSSYWYDLEKIGFFDDIPEVEGIMNEDDDDLPYKVGQKVRFDDLNDNGFLFKNTGIIKKITNQYYLINDGTKDIKYALGPKMEVLKNNDDDLDDDYEIEINTLDILNKYQEEKSLKGNAEFTLESDDNTYQVEFEYLNNSNQLNLFDIETLDGIVVEFNKNNLEIIKNEIIHQLNMYNELNIENNKKLFSEEDNSHNKLILSTIFDSEINFNEFIERIENHIFDDKSSQNIRNIIYGGFTTQDKINEIGKFIFNNLKELVNNIFDYSDFEKENLLNNFGDDEREEIFYQLSNDIVNFENKYIYANSYDEDEDDGLDEEELENERPFQPEDQNLLLTILDNLDKNFPTPRVEFYYPFENVECSTLMSLEKINNFLSVENEDYESIMVVDDYKLVSLMPDIIEFEDLLRRLYTNIPDSNLENGEDILYMNLSDGTNSIKLKIYIGAELHDILAN